MEPAYDELPIVFAVTDEIVQNCDFIIPANIVQLIYACHSPASQSSSLSRSVVTRSQSKALTVDCDDDNGSNGSQSCNVSAEPQTVDHVDKPFTDLTKR